MLFLCSLGTIDLLVICNGKRTVWNVSRMFFQVCPARMWVHEEGRRKELGEWSLRGSDVGAPGTLPLGIARAAWEEGMTSLRGGPASEDGWGWSWRKD